MPYSSKAVANHFIGLALRGGIPHLTPMKLQRLLYLAQVFHLRRSGSPLILDIFQKWETGPALPSIYHALKHLGANAIGCELMIPSPDGKILKPMVHDSDQAALRLLDQIALRYGAFSGPELSAIAIEDFFPGFRAKKDGDPISDDELQSAAEHALAKHEARAISGAMAPGAPHALAPFL